MLPGRVSSQTSHRTRSSKRTEQSNVTEAILQFGSQITTSLMTMAEQYRLDAMRREELTHQETMAIRQEAAEKGQEAQLKQGLADRTAKTAVSVAI